MNRAHFKQLLSIGLHMHIANTVITLYACLFYFLRLNLMKFSLHFLNQQIGTAAGIRTLRYLSNVKLQGNCVRIRKQAAEEVTLQKEDQSDVVVNSISRTVQQRDH